MTAIKKMPKTNVTNQKAKRGILSFTEGQNCWETRLRHCYREGNKVADKLANLGVGQEERLLFFDNPPRELTSLLREDFEGVTTPRLIM